MIAIEDLHKAYGGTTAVAGLSFGVAGGQILGLVGPNGAGKSTTLKAVSGMIRPSRGRLQVDGFDVDRNPVAAKARLACILDDPQLFVELTVEEHLAFIASAYGVADADAKAAGLLETFELVARRRTPADELSRGMRQKLALCCAFLHEPSALLLDEPMTGLDPRGIRRLKETLRQRAERGAAVVISSHLLAMVEDVCTHVLILDGGRQRFCGSLQELKAVFADGEPGERATLESVFFLATEETEPASAGDVPCGNPAGGPVGSEEQPL